MAIVYLATNLINGKRYIGVTVGSLRARVRKHFNDAVKRPKPTRIGAALLKYADLIRFTVLLRDLTYDEALGHEVRLIALWKPEYNISAGGKGLSGYRHPPDVLERIAAKNTGKKGFWKGKRLPEHVSESIRVRMAKPENKRFILACRHLGVAARMRAVVCLNDGMTFESAQAAANHYGIPDGSRILKVCKRSPRRSSAAGRVFRFADDEVGLRDDPALVIERAKKSRLVTGSEYFSRRGRGKDAAAA